MSGARLGLGLAVALCVTVAQAHIIYGTKTVREQVAEADLVLHARILSVGEPVSITTERGSASRPTVEARVLGVLKGSFEAARVRFAQHGHGVTPFAEGDEALLFLLDIERTRELGELARTGAVHWVSIQEHDQAYALTDATRVALLEATRDYVVAASGGSQAPEALRRATLSLLTSGDADLAAAALRDLVLAPGAPLLVAEDVPRLSAVLDDPGTSMGVRTALLTELSRRGLVEAGPVWQRLLSDEGPARDRVTAIRAAGPSGGAAVRPRLVALLADPDADVAAAAAAALGRRGDTEAVAPLARALDHEVARVRMAAIRGLGRIDTPAADAALRKASASHADPATRRRARTELDKRQRARAAAEQVAD